MWFIITHCPTVKGTSVILGNHSSKCSLLWFQPDTNLCAFQVWVTILVFLFKQETAPFGRIYLLFILIFQKKCPWKLGFSSNIHSSLVHLWHGCNMFLVFGTLLVSCKHQIVIKCFCKGFYSWLNFFILNNVPKNDNNFVCVFQLLSRLK